MSSPRSSTSSDTAFENASSFDTTIPSPITAVQDDPEMDLLAAVSTSAAPTATAHSRKTAPVFTGDVFDAAGTNVFPQRALYGQVMLQSAEGFPEQLLNRKIYINSNAPFSALVCGVQGSGKSHSTSVLLESCLIRDERIGTLPAPLSGLV